MFENWTPQDLIALATLTFQALLAFAVFVLKREVNGRFSQMIDLIGRLGGAPDRRASNSDRRSQEKAHNGET